MPTMFDSHDEFNEWFSKDIESHAEKQSGIDESKYSLYFMLVIVFNLCFMYCKIIQVTGNYFQKNYLKISWAIIFGEYLIS